MDDAQLGPRITEVVDGLRRVLDPDFTYERAVETYRELVALEPDNADFRNNFGILLVRSGNIGPSIEQFEAALKINPAHEAARRNLELARKKLSQH